MPKESPINLKVLKLLKSVQLIKSNDQKLIKSFFDQKYLILNI